VKVYKERKGVKKELKAINSQITYVSYKEVMQKDVVHNMRESQSGHGG
jgi:hypothetical protein